MPDTASPGSSPGGGDDGSTTISGFRGTPIAAFARSVLNGEEPATASGFARALFHTARCNIAVTIIVLTCVIALVVAIRSYGIAFGRASAICFGTAALAHEAVRDGMQYTLVEALRLIAVRHTRFVSMLVFFLVLVQGVSAERAPPPAFSRTLHGRIGGSVIRNQTRTTTNAILKFKAPVIETELDEYDLQQARILSDLQKAFLRGSPQVDTGLAFASRAAVALTATAAVAHGILPAYAVFMSILPCAHATGSGPFDLPSPPLRITLSGSVSLGETVANALDQNASWSAVVDLSRPIAVCSNPDCPRGGEMQRCLRCQRCRLAPYCSTECQTADWPRHRHVCRCPDRANASNVTETCVECPSECPPPSPPLSPPTTELVRCDHLTKNQASQLYVELMAGNAAPVGLPNSLKCLIICDSGAGTTICPSDEHFEKGSLVESTSRVLGVDGPASCGWRGTARLCMTTTSGDEKPGLYHEKRSIKNPRCPFVLMAIGRASIEQGVCMVMPSWGLDGYFEFQNGVRVPLLNRHVLIVRPFGYKNNPSLGLVSISVEAFGIPPDGDFGLGLAAGHQRAGDLESHLSSVIRLVVVDTCRGGAAMDLTHPDVGALVLEVASWPRCRFVFSCVDCRKFSAAQLLPKPDGSPATPARSWPDHIEGFRNADGSLPPGVVASNIMACLAAEASLACCAHDGEFACETPACRRAGFRDATPGCEQHAYMFDMPCWVNLTAAVETSLTTFDQCETLDDPQAAFNTGPKATAILSSEKLGRAIAKRFGHLRCTHAPGTHKPIRGATADGRFMTAGTEVYSSRMNQLVAQSVIEILGSVDRGEVTAMVAGVLHGKRLPKGSVDGKFFHAIANHSEHRVVKHLIDAWSDAEPWWIDALKDVPCEDCLLGDAPAIGPTGQVPTDEGLIYVDVWHCSIPALHTGSKARIGCKHANTLFYKSVPIKAKSDAPEAIELFLAFFNSVGRPITWIHCDQANDLRAGGVAALARKHNIRITTTVAGVSRTNAVEPMHRPMGKVIRVLLKASLMPLCFYGYACAYFEEGQALRPSRSPPHDCSLGRLLKERPKGAYRRPFGCYCVFTVAPRLPSDTLVNKAKAQGVRCLHLGYYGGRGGHYETLGIQRASPGYLGYDPVTNSVLCGESVRFVPWCFPGLKRSAGGGWIIPPERIPFSAESLYNKTKEEVEPPSKEVRSTSKSDPPKGQPTSEKLVDLEAWEPDDQAGDFEYDRVSFRSGFPVEEEVDASSRGGAGNATNTTGEASNTDAEKPTKAAAREKATPRRRLIPRNQWPNDKCEEHNGVGWEVEILEERRSKNGTIWAKCKWVNAADTSGKRFQSVWRNLADLLPVPGEPDAGADERDGAPQAPPTVATEPVTLTPSPPVPVPASGDALVPEAAETHVHSTSDVGPVPNQDTVPWRPGASPLEEPVRPARERRPPERLEPTMLSARYAAAGAITYNEDGSVDWQRVSASALYVDVEATCARMCELITTVGWEADVDGVGDARQQPGVEPRERFLSLPVEVQRAACVMADHDVFASELGSSSPQAMLTREVYAAAGLAAAQAGYSVPALEPLYTAVPPAKAEAARELNVAAVAAAEGVAGVEALAAVKQGITVPAFVSHRWHGASSMPNDTSFVTTCRLDPSCLPSVREEDIFDDLFDGYVFSAGTSVDTLGEFACLAKAKTSPDIYSEREMKGKEWDEPKQVEVNALEKMGAFTKIRADDARIKGWKVVDTMWTGRVKRKADRTVDKLKGRAVLRGDLHKHHYSVDQNQSTAPVVRNTSMTAVDALAALRQQHTCSYDVSSAYLQGEQLPSEQVVARPPPGFRERDSDGVEILWLMNNPLYGQTDAGAIWNRTFNQFATKGTQSDCGTSRSNEAHVVAAASVPEPPTDGLGLERCPHDPCIYSRIVNDKQDRLTTILYVDDGRMYWDPTPDAEKAAKIDLEKLNKRFGVKTQEVDQPEDYFLGANRRASKERDVVKISMESYIDAMVERYCGGDVSPSKEYPASWSHSPADEELVSAYEEAIATRTPAEPKLFTEYNSVVGSLRHGVKYRPEISAAMDLLGCCLTFATWRLLRAAYRVLVYLGRTKRLGTTFSKHAPRAAELYARADANWRTTRSTSGFCIFLAGAAIASSCSRQHCIAMSTTEAELYALAACAIELLYIISLLEFLGYVCSVDIVVETDNKGAYDLCHRYTSAQHSRHIERKLFKMREMRGAGLVQVRYVPTGENTADLFTKILSRQPFEKHRKVVLNLPASMVSDTLSDESSGAVAFVSRVLARMRSELGSTPG